jgi:hypothetical protein
VDNESESEARKERLAEEAEERIRRGAHWADWTYVADGFAVGRAKAMRAAGTNQPYGKAYTRTFGEWLADRPWTRHIDTGTRSVLLWVADHRSEVEAWRETLAQNERAKLNHPTALKRRYDAAHKIARADPNTAKKETGREALVRENEDMWAKVKKLEHQVESGDGSLFDLRRDSIESIVDVIAGTIPVGRFQSLQRAMTNKLAELKAAEKTKTAKAG